MRPNLTDNPDLPHLISQVSTERGLDAAAAAVRRLIDSVVRHGDGPETSLDLDKLALRIHELADEVDASAPPLDTRMVEMWAQEANKHDPTTGLQNPIAPPLTFTGLADGTVECVVTLPIAYQGQPKMAHGGLSALMLDHACGVANGWAGRSGMTVHLELDYRAPVPLFVPVTIRARQTSNEGRKIWTEGTISAEGRVCVEAKGLFIAGHLPRPGGGPAPR